MSLAAVEQAALADARAEAEAIRNAASEHLEQVVAGARAEADELVARHRARIDQLAQLEEHRRLAEARAQARAMVLEARRSLLDEVREAARAAAKRLVVEDPRFGALIQRLSSDARERLAPGGPVQLSASPDGGVIARAGSLGIDYSIRAQVDRCLETAAGQLERLWR